MNNKYPEISRTLLSLSLSLFGLILYVSVMVTYILLKHHPGSYKPGEHHLGFDLHYGIFLSFFFLVLSIFLGGRGIQAQFSENTKISSSEYFNYQTVVLIGFNLIITTIIFTL
jgi:hypothetical protein